MYPASPSADKKPPAVVRFIDCNNPCMSPTGHLPIIFVSTGQLVDPMQTIPMLRKAVCIEVQVMATGQYGRWMMADDD
jgi:hypothetical protein